eukprot:gene25225-10870_t
MVVVVGDLRLSTSEDEELERSDVLGLLAHFELDDLGEMVAGTPEVFERAREVTERWRREQEAKWNKERDKTYDKLHLEEHNRMVHVFAAPMGLDTSKTLVGAMVKGINSEIARQHKQRANAIKREKDNFIGFSGRRMSSVAGSIISGAAAGRGLARSNLTVEGVSAAAAMDGGRHVKKASYISGAFGLRGLATSSVEAQRATGKTDVDSSRHMKKAAFLASSAGGRSASSVAGYMFSAASAGRGLARYNLTVDKVSAAAGVDGGRHVKKAAFLASTAGGRSASSVAGYMFSAASAWRGLARSNLTVDKVSAVAAMDGSRHVKKAAFLASSAGGRRASSVAGYMFSAASAGRGLARSNLTVDKLSAVAAMDGSRNMKKELQLSMHAELNQRIQAKMGSKAKPGNMELQLSMHAELNQRIQAKMGLKAKPGNMASSRSLGSGGNELGGSYASSTGRRGSSKSVRSIRSSSMTLSARTRETIEAVNKHASRSPRVQLYSDICEKAEIIPNLEISMQLARSEQSHHFNIASVDVVLPEATVLAQVLPSCIHLKSFTLSRIVLLPQVVSVLLPAIWPLPLKALELKNTEITPENLTELKNALLRPSETLEDPQPSFENLTELEEHPYVSCETTSRPPALYETLTGSSLHSYGPSGDTADAPARFVDAGLADLTVPLSSMQCLTHLNLRQIGITDWSASQVASLIQNCPHLISLELSANGMGQLLGITDWSASQVESLIQNCPNLISLDLSANGMGQLSGEALAAALPHSPKLRVLKLGWNSMGHVWVG